jgi:hypothetical protein
MSTAAVICPHCGARQAERDPRRPDEKDSQRALSGDIATDKARALLAMNAAVDGKREMHSVADVIADVLRPRTPGAWRLLEVALTVLAVPLLALALVAPKLFGARRRPRTVVVSSAQIVIAVPIAGVLAYAVAIGAGANERIAFTVVGVMMGAWVARELLRWVTRRD